jgi:hypothetical protein
MPRLNYIGKLQEAIRETEACESDHIDTIPVIERVAAKIAWEGKVEVFNLIGHPKAKRCYAWSYEQDGTTLATIVLNLPPVDSPESAVKVAIAAKAKEFANYRLQGA